MIVSDFGDSYRSYRGCKFLLLGFSDCQILYCLIFQQQIKHSLVLTHALRIYASGNPLKQGSSYSSSCHCTEAESSAYITLLCVTASAPHSIWKDAMPSTNFGHLMDCAKLVSYYFILKANSKFQNSSGKNLNVMICPHRCHWNPKKKIWSSTGG